jgi:hypothetical protein
VVTIASTNVRSGLVLVYAGLVVLGYLLGLLPGGAERSGGEWAFWIAVDVALIVFVARGSQVAIVIAMSLNLAFLLAASLAWLAVETLHPPVVPALFAVAVAQMLVLALLWLAGGRSSRTHAPMSPGRPSTNAA